MIVGLNTTHTEQEGNQQFTTSERESIVLLVQIPIKLKVVCMIA